MIHTAADNESGVKIRGREYGRDHRGSRRFAVRAGNGNAVFQAHQLRQHFGARNHGNFQAMRFDYFDVLRMHRRGNHHYMRAMNVFRLMAFANHSAETFQSLRHGGGFQIRARNGVAGRKQDFGDAAHAASADAHQMDTLKIPERDVHCRVTPASPSSRPTISSTACGCASVRARFSISVILRGWSRREKISFVSRSGVNSPCGISRAAPADCMASALRVWWASVAAPKGMKMAARPAADISATVIAPDRQTIRSA